MSFTLLGFILYLLIILVVGLITYKSNKSHYDFFLGGRKVNHWVVAFSERASGESAWLLLGLTGMGFAVGAQAYWVVVGEVIGVALSWMFVSRRLKRMSDAHASITVPDVLAARFADTWKVIRRSKSLWNR